MIVDDITYDIDNRDIEGEMYIQELEEEAQEEQDIEDAQEEDENEKESQEAEKSYYQSRRILNTKNLSLDLDIPAEELRPIYVWESLKNNQIYEGCVVYKFDSSSYIFNASVVGENDYKLRKFSLDNIKQIKK